MEKMKLVNSSGYLEEKQAALDQEAYENGTEP